MALPAELGRLQTHSQQDNFRDLVQTFVSILDPSIELHSPRDLSSQSVSLLRAQVEESERDSHHGGSVNDTDDTNVPVATITDPAVLDAQEQVDHASGAAVTGENYFHVFVTAFLTTAELRSIVHRVLHLPAAFWVGTASISARFKLTMLCSGHTPAALEASSVSYTMDGSCTVLGSAPLDTEPPVATLSTFSRQPSTSGSMHKPQSVPIMSKRNNSISQSEFGAIDCAHVAVVQCYVCFFAVFPEPCSLINLMLSKFVEISGT